MWGDSTSQKEKPFRASVRSRVIARPNFLTTIGTLKGTMKEILSLITNRMKKSNLPPLTIIWVRLSVGNWCDWIVKKVELRMRRGSVLSYEGDWWIECTLNWMIYREMWFLLLVQLSVALCIFLCFFLALCFLLFDLMFIIYRCLIAVDLCRGIELRSEHVLHVPPSLFLVTLLLTLGRVI